MVLPNPTPAPGDAVLEDFDLTCQESIIDVLLLRDDRHRSSRLKAREQEQGIRKTVTEAAIHLKKRKFILYSDTGSSSLTLALNPDGLPDENDDDGETVDPVPNPSEAVSVPAWRVEDLQLLGHSCNINVDHLHTLAIMPTSAVDPLD